LISVNFRQSTAARQKTFSREFSASRPLARVHPNQIVRSGIVELVARSLVMHVGVEPVGSQERDGMLAVGALALEPRQLIGERDDLLVELLARVKPYLPV
jgi:hypothetical protein